MEVDDEGGDTEGHGARGVDGEKDDPEIHRKRVVLRVQLNHPVVRDGVKQGEDDIKGQLRKGLGKVKRQQVIEAVLPLVVKRGPFLAN